MLPVGGLATHAIASPASEMVFSAPDGSLVLTRELRRELSRGKQLVTRRNYRIAFVRDGDGWRVDGELIDCQVDAPPELDALAQIEKARPDVGLFPLYLDSSGRIVEQRGSRADAASTTEARAVVSKAVAGIAMAPQDRAIASTMVQRIAAQSHSSGGRWPEDLFRPASGHRSEVRNMALPDGSEGRITVTTDAAGSGDGMLDHFERNVVTELGGTRRESMEVFRLARMR
jgi:hypothetical protein